jgi:hypothetical protein
VAAAIVPKPYPPQPTALLVLVTAVVVTVWELVGGEPGLATSIKRCGGTCCRSWNFKKLILHAIFDRQIWSVQPFDSSALVQGGAMVRVSVRA